MAVIKITGNKQQGFSDTPIEPDKTGFPVPGDPGTPEHPEEPGPIGDDDDDLGNDYEKPHTTSTPSAESYPANDPQDMYEEMPFAEGKNSSSIS